MMFYTQIKREFTRASWQRGQNYFRQERVGDVRLDNDLVVAKVQGTEDGAYDTAIQMARGTIFNSKCSCPAHRVYETHCKHVAALAIWVVERGSLLRASVSAAELGVGQRETEFLLKDPQAAASDPRLSKLIRYNPVLARSQFAIRRDKMAGSVEGKEIGGATFSIPITLVEAAALQGYVAPWDEAAAQPDPLMGEPVLFVRGLFAMKTLTGVSVESAIRYNDPHTGSVQINTLTYLVKTQEPGVWKTTQGLLLRVPAPETGTLDSPVSDPIASLQYPKIVYQGQAALERLAELLGHPNRDRIIFDRSLNAQVEWEPLQLTSMKIGARENKGRKLSFEFKGAGVTFTSEELEELAKQGRLSSQYVWKDNRIYRFETSLAQICGFSNRSGVDAPEGGPEGEPSPGGVVPVTGFGSIHDDSDSPLHPLAAYRLSLELGVEKMEVDSDWTEFHEWKKTFDKKRLPSLPKVPYGYKLRGYQKNGLTWLWSLYHRGLSALLADEMGLGKTHQVLALLSSFYRVKKGRPKLPSLVVAPTSVIAAWSQKLTKYKTGLKWHVFHGAGRKLPDKGVDLILTTYGLLYREEALREREWHLVILDEAQAIKNAGTISSRASRALKGRFKIAMTGTPVENQPADLWSLQEFLIPGYLGSLPRFKRLYGWGRELPSDTRAASLRRMISPFLLRRTKAKVLKELPEKTEEVVLCEMTTAQKIAYRAVLNGAEAAKARDNLQKGGKIDYANILAVLTRLKQACDHPRLADYAAEAVALEDLDPSQSGKWDTLEELISEALDSRLKVVVFSQYLGVLDLLGRVLHTKGVGFTEIRGDTADRGARLKKFAEDPSCQVFLCSLLAGGLGIDLTSASVCIHFDRWWNPAKENQATDRLHRYGQTRGVQVFKLQIPGTVEDRIASIISSKVKLSGALIEESSLGLKSFSRKDLLSLLNPDADFGKLPEST